VKSISLKDIFGEEEVGGGDKKSNTAAICLTQKLKPPEEKKKEEKRIENRRIHRVVKILKDEGEKGVRDKELPASLLHDGERGKNNLIRTVRRKEEGGMKRQPNNQILGLTLEKGGENLSSRQNPRKNEGIDSKRCGWSRKRKKRGERVTGGRSGDVSLK